MFDSQEFIASCQAAIKEHSPELAIKELVERVMSQPSEVVSALGTPTQGGVTPLYRSDELIPIRFDNVISPVASWRRVGSTAV